MAIVKNARAAALQLLARRDHSGWELTQKLSARFAPEEIAAAVHSLQQQGLVDDLRFACAYVRYASGRLGEPRLRYDLQQRGVAAHQIDEALATALSTPEDERALMILRQKYKTVPKTDSLRAQAARFLQARGFAAATAMGAIKEYWGAATDETDWSG